MRSRGSSLTPSLLSLALAAILAALWLAPASASKAWTPSRTPDGRPDLQGIWLNNAATPLERPLALAGQSRLTDDEVAELRRRAAALMADDRNDIAVGDNLFLAVLGNAGRYKNPAATGGAADMIEREFDNRTSLIVDPADGRIPWTAMGKRRNDAAAAARRAEVPAGPEDLTTDMRCLTYGVPRLGFNNFNSAGPLGYHQIVQTPRYVVLLYRSDSRGARHHARAPAAPAGAYSAVERRLDRPMGRRHARRRHHEFHAAAERAGRGSGPAPGRALHARRSRSARLRAHALGCGGVCRAGERAHSPQADHGAALRVRLS